MNGQGGVLSYPPTWVTDRDVTSPHDSTIGSPLTIPSSSNLVTRERQQVLNLHAVVVVPKSCILADYGSRKSSKDKIYFLVAFSILPRQKFAVGRSILIKKEVCY